MEHDANGPAAEPARTEADAAVERFVAARQSRMAGQPRIGEWEPRRRGWRERVGDWEWLRPLANVTLVLTSLAGIVGGGWVIGTTLKARHDINSACDGLVSAGRVLALSQSDGRVSARDGQHLRTDRRPCALFTTAIGDGDRSREFFRAAAGTLRTWKQEPESSVGVITSGWPPQLRPVAQPVGGYVDATITDTDVRVLLPCRTGKLDGRPVEALWASAGLTQPPGGTANRQDRRVLTEIAIGAVNRLAGRAGCERGWAMPPDDLPEDPPQTPQPAILADGTCRFARSLPGDAYPDEALTASLNSHVSEESCDLTMSNGAASALWHRNIDRRSPYDSPTGPGEYWASLNTYYGHQAKRVELSRYDTADDEPMPVRPGTAGRVERSVWWASSTCRDGGPAVHTLSLGAAYADLAARDWAKGFRAYVEDVAERRGCTDLKFPDVGSFRPRDWN